MLRCARINLRPHSALSFEAPVHSYLPFGSSTTSQLAKNTKYKVVVTTRVSDEADNHLDQNATTSGNQNKVWYFSTGLT